MKRSLFILGIIALFILGMSLASFGGNQWIGIGPEGVTVRAIVINPQTPETLYIGTVGFGVLKSIDSGATWVPANNGLINLDIMALAIDPQTPEIIYAGTEATSLTPGGVFRSIDGGTTWESSLHYIVGAITINPVIPTTVYAGTGNYSGSANGAFKSIDGGLTWNSINTGLPVPPGGVTALAVNPQSPETLYAGASRWGGFNELYSIGVLKSFDGGNTWAPTTLTDHELSSVYSYVSAIVTDPQRPGTIYAETTGDGVFKSIDGGTTWMTMNTGLTSLYVRALAINPQKPDDLYAGTSGGVFRSIDGGTTWVAFKVGLPDSAVRTLAINPQAPEILYAGTNGFGVFKIQAGAGPTLGVSKPGTGGGTVTSDPAGIICGATCLESYNPGTIVTLTATAESGSTFEGWSGACSGTGICSVTVDDDKTVVATFNLELPQNGLKIGKLGTGSGTVTSTPPGINCGSTCQANFTTGTNIVLTALADAGSTFFGWSGGGCSGTGPCAIILSSDTTVAVLLGSGNCSYTILPTNKTFNAMGGSVSIKMSASSTAEFKNCPAPLVVEEAEWISVSGTPTWKANKGTVKLAVQRNPGSHSRTGVVTIGGETLTIEQDGVICQMTALKPPFGKYPNTGGSGSFDIKVSPQDCGWNVATPLDWIHLDTTTGTGSGTATFHLDANGAGKNRTGKIDVSLAQSATKKKTFTVNENK
jgi:hypothetical protein